MTTNIRTKLLPSRETKEALYMRHPRNILKFLFIPKSVVRSQRKVVGTQMDWDLEIEDWWAKENDL